MQCKPAGEVARQPAAQHCSRLLVGLLTPGGRPALRRCDHFRKCRLHIASVVEGPAIPAACAAEYLDEVSVGLKRQSSTAHAYGSLANTVPARSTSLADICHRFET